MPLVGPHVRLPEVTLKALALGAALSVTLAAANAYIGLLVGLTVSASIPAAAVSMGVLRAFRRSNILENNLVQTAASAGESLVAGVIFTVPALVMMGAWSDYHYGPLVAIAITGGVMGVAFTIPLRRALIVEADLKFPEGVATAEVLKTGGIARGADAALLPGETAHDDEAARHGFRRLIEAAGLGALVKLLESAAGWLAGSVAGVGAWAQGRCLMMGSFYLSPSLLGVGFIVGLNIAVLVFLGGLLGTFVGVPLNWAIRSESIMAAVGIDPQTPWEKLAPAQWKLLAGQAWSDCRRIGVGAMIVGGVWSIISLAKPLLRGVQASLAAYRAARGGGGANVPRTEVDIPINFVALTIIASLAPVFAIFYWALGDFPDKLTIAAVMTLLMTVFGFVFASVAGYMAGLVGSSNNPISGVTVATVIVSALILSQLIGVEGDAATVGPMAVIYLAALVCSAAAIAGDNMQDLKCGYLLGATPWRQQLFQIVGVVSAAFAIPWVLRVLDAGKGIGRAAQEGVEPLAAPQAALMKDMATGIFGAGIQWNFIYIGFALAVALIGLDELQKRRGSAFRFPVLAVAVGVYLPVGLSIPILLGGLLTQAIAWRSRQADPKVQQARENTGLLVASGLITGEALMGVGVSILAVWLASRGKSLPAPHSWAGALGLLTLAAMMLYLYRRTMSGDGSR